MLTSLLRAVGVTFAGALAAGFRNFTGGGFLVSFMVF